MKEAFLDPLYDVAIEGLPLLGTPDETASRFLARSGSLEARAESMSATHLALCASTGFVCGLGGFLTLPITLPANVAGVAIIQLHLCASTALLSGLDPRAPEVRSRCVACLTGATVEAERDVPQEVLDRSAVKIAERGVRLLAEAAVGLAELAGRLGARTVLARRLPRRSLPVVGGVIGGISDLYSTQKVAAAARAAFLPTVETPVDTPVLDHAGDGAL